MKCSCYLVERSFLDPFWAPLEGTMNGDLGTVMNYVLCVTKRIITS
jgi:hypothetical protein